MLTVESLAACTATLDASSLGAENAPDAEWFAPTFPDEVADASPAGAPRLRVPEPPDAGGALTERQERRLYVNAFAAFFG